MDQTTQHIPTRGQPSAPQPPPPPPRPAAGPPPVGPPPSAAPPPEAAEPEKPARRLSDPLSIVLIVVIVLALVAALGILADWIARGVADDKVAKAALCVVQHDDDQVDVSFGPTSFLWQHVNGHYDNITVKVGDKIRAAQGMNAEVSVDDVRLDGTADSKGTIGALDATLTWTAEGIKKTVQDSVPVFGNLVTGVQTNPSDRTVELTTATGNAKVSPEVVNGRITLKVISVNLGAFGFEVSVPTDTVQGLLDGFTQPLNDYPLGIKADSIDITENGVAAHFSTRNATIPKEGTNDCFKDL